MYAHHHQIQVVDFPLYYVQVINYLVIMIHYHHYNDIQHIQQHD